MSAITETRFTTHHASRREANEAMQRQINDARYPIGAAFEVEQTSVGDDSGQVDRFAVKMTWPVAVHDEVQTRSEMRADIACAYLALQGAPACEATMKAIIILDGLLGRPGERQRTEALLNAHAMMAGRPAVHS